MQVFLVKSVFCSIKLLVLFRLELLIKSRRSDSSEGREFNE